MHEHVFVVTNIQNVHINDIIHVHNIYSIHVHVYTCKVSKSGAIIWTVSSM